MKMKKYLSIAILLMLMATPLVFTSCGGDDLVEGIENRNQPPKYGLSHITLKAHPLKM